MKKKHMLLDVDGVLRDWWGIARLCINEFGKVPLKYMPLETDKMTNPEDLSNMYGARGDDYAREFERCAFDPGLSTMIINRMAESFPWANVLYDYLKNKYKLTICSTQKHPFNQVLTEKWLFNNIRNFNSECIFIRDKFMVEADYLLDDHPRNLEAWSVHRGQAFGLKKQYNKHLVDNDMIFIGDAPSIIEELEKNF